MTGIINLPTDNHKYEQILAVAATVKSATLEMLNDNYDNIDVIQQLIEAHATLQFVAGQLSVAQEK